VECTLEVIVLYSGVVSRKRRNCFGSCFLTLEVVLLYHDTKVGSGG